MNKRQIRYILSFIFIIALAAGFVACDGPAGPRGEQGPQGDKGENGDPGTANVFYSEWLDIEWDLDEDDRKRMDIIEPRITEKFMSRGTTLMYLKIIDAGGVSVHLLPYLNSNDQRHNYYMRTEGFYNNLSPDAFPDEAGLTFYILKDEGVIYEGFLEEIRYILIPGGLPAKIPAAFWDNYETVAKYYGIPD